jgi:FkbM family methyltransferase
MSHRPEDFTKEFFQRSWGTEGYYEKFSYGVGIDKVIQICLLPFLTAEKVALEIGSGGGTFTDYMVGKTKHTTAIDVIKMPTKFSSYPKFNYMEMPDRDFTCPGMAPDNFDFAFCYNVFCHLSNGALKEYINKGIRKVVKPGGDFVFMLANFKFTSQKFENSHEFKREENRLTPVGHFHQDEQTVHEIVNPIYWDIVNADMLPGHRDLVIHIRKKANVVETPMEEKLTEVAHETNPVRLPFVSCAIPLNDLMKDVPLPVYSQNDEQAIIMKYFGDRRGRLLDIGANDGVTLSNSRALMLSGWEGVLVEPSPKAFARLQNVYSSTSAVLLEVCVGPETRVIEFWESGAFEHTGPDVALLSCINPKEKERWGEKVAFEPIKVQQLSFKSLLKSIWAHIEVESVEDLKFQFINIDAEGMDYEILQQIDLNAVGCECFCIEHNSIPENSLRYISYANKYGFREIGRNAENLIFAK